MQLSAERNLFVHAMGNAIRVTAIFTDDASANTYMHAHPNEGVIATYGNIVLLADVNNLGTPLIAEHSSCGALA